MGFIYRIPCQGERPIHFKVKGLPSGLNLDAEKGIITGVAPEKTGDYLMTFEAKNAHGKDPRQNDSVSLSKRVASVSLPSYLRAIALRSRAKNCLLSIKSTAFSFIVFFVNSSCAGYFASRSILAAWQAFLVIVIKVVPA